MSSFFASTVRQFANEQIVPLVRGMDEAAGDGHGPDPQALRPRPDGHRDSRGVWRRGGTFFDAILAVEAISAVDPAVGVLVDVQNTLCINALLRWGRERRSSSFLPRLATETVGRLRAERSRIGLRRLRAADARGEARRRLHPERPEAVDHQCAWRPACSSSLPPLDPAAGYKGITAFLVEKGTRRILCGQEGRQARHPRLAAPASSSSTTAWFRPRRCWANPAKATRSPSRR